MVAAITVPRLAWALLCLLAVSPHVDTYSRGAPDSACTDNMMPRHGFDVQVTKLQTRQTAINIYKCLANFLSRLYLHFHMFPLRPGRRQ